MAEATSSLIFTQIQLQVADYLGYGTTSGAWSAAETAEIARIIARGLRQFYGAYAWSFLNIRTTFDTVAGDNVYDLPDLFGDVIEGDMTFADDDPIGPVVRQDSAESVRRFLANNQNYTGRPQRYAIETTNLGGTTGLRKQVIMWPIPDQVYTLGYYYRVNQNDITGSNYPAGGAQQAETALASCLACAELKKTEKKGSYWDDWQYLLAQAIRTEKRAVAGFVKRDQDDRDVWYPNTVITGVGV